MTFIEWCLEDTEEDIDLDIHTVTGKHYPPGVPVLILELELLKPLEIVDEPVLENNVWHLTLDDTVYKAE